jgi:alpha-L-arabinofuranosidase
MDAPASYGVRVPATAELARDALIASVSLDIMNKHSRRVRMANIAQMVNVLQAVILTDGPRMVLTPTYHVFDMYRVHFDATLLNTAAQLAEYQLGDESIPAISLTASKSAGGRINLTMTNLNATEAQRVDIDVRGQNVGNAAGGRVLTANAVDAINTFEAPETVTVREFSDFQLRNNALSVTLPARSVVVLTLR